MGMQIPGTLGQYDIRGRLGRGRASAVHDGWDPVAGRRVAIKTVALPADQDAETAAEIARFRRTARAVRRLVHPNVVAILDDGQTDDVAYVVMEFVDGPTLQALLDAGDRFPLAGVRRIMADLLAGLRYGHEHGVVHRNLHPGNVMLTGQGQARIADFGIAGVEIASLTQPGVVPGLPAYLSPEQFRGEIVDARTDIWSAGVLLYQLLTGERPFAGGLTAIMHKVLTTEPPAPSALAGTAPAALDDVVRTAMAKRPQDRFVSAAAFAEALRAALAAPAATAPVADASPPDDAVLSDDAALPPDDDATLRRPPPPGPAPAPAPAAAVRGRTAVLSAAPAPARKTRAPLFAGVVAIVVVALAGAGYFFTRPAPPPPSIPAQIAQAAPVAVPTAAPPSPVPVPPAAPAEPPALPVAQAPVAQAPVAQAPVAQAPIAQAPIAQAPAPAPPPEPVPAQPAPALAEVTVAPLAAPAAVPAALIAAEAVPAPSPAAPSPAAPTPAAPTPAAPAPAPPAPTAVEAVPPAAPAAAAPAPAAEPPVPAVAEATPVPPPPAIEPAPAVVEPPPPAVAEATPVPPAPPPPAIEPAPAVVETPPPAVAEATPVPPAPSPAAAEPAPAVVVAAPSPPPAAAPAAPAETPAAAAAKEFGAQAMAPAAMADQITKTLRAARCTLAVVMAQDSGEPSVHGVADAATEAALHRQVGDLAGGQPLGWYLRPIAPVFCPALALLRPISVLAGAPGPGVGLTLNADRTVLQDGEPILPRITMPNFAGDLRVDYLSRDGSLAHLYPTLPDPAAKLAAQPAKKLAAGAHLALGDPGPGRPQWQSGAPYGIDMIVAVASSVPLRVAAPRNLEEKSDAYLADLGHAIEQARAAGARVSGALVLVEAVPRPN